MRAAFLALALIAPAALSAQQPAVEVQLSNFKFTPGTINLHAGQSVTLHLVNTAHGGHNFAAPEFFAAASHVSGPVSHGAVDVPGGQSVDITLTPAHGTYHLRCTHTMHTAFGMTGQIVVD